MFDTSKDTMLENKNLGILFRTKGVISNEGGVNSGYSVIDNPFLAEIPDLNNIKSLVNDVWLRLKLTLFQILLFIKIFMES